MLFDNNISPMPLHDAAFWFIGLFLVGVLVSGTPLVLAAYSTFLAALACLVLGKPYHAALMVALLCGSFYASAYAGYLCYRSGRLVKWLSPPFYFCFGNLAMLIGLLRFCAGKQRPAWGRSRL